MILCASRKKTLHFDNIDKVIDQKFFFPFFSTVDKNFKNDLYILRYWILVKPTYYDFSTRFLSNFFNLSPIIKIPRKDTKMVYLLYKIRIINR